MAGINRRRLAPPRPNVVKLTLGERPKRRSPSGNKPIAATSGPSSRYRRAAR